MSTVSFNPELLQSGLLGGARLYQQQQQLAQQQQYHQDLLGERYLAYQQEAAQRKERADQMYRRQKANEMVLRSILSPPESAIPTGGQGQYGPFPQEAQGGMMGGDPMQGLDLATLSDASPELLGHLTDREQARAELMDAKATIDMLRNGGGLKNALAHGPTLTRWQRIGADRFLRPEDYPPGEAEIKRQEQDQERQGLVDSMTIEQDPSTGEHVQDWRKAQQLGRLDLTTLRALRLRHEAEMAQKQKAAAVEAEIGRLHAQPWYGSLPPNRQYAAESMIRDGGHPTLETLTEPKPMEDRYTQAKASNIEGDAKEDYDRAVKEYESLNVSGTDKLGLLPPTPEEEALAKRGKPDSSWFSTDGTDEKNYRKAVAKVGAWERVKAARDRIQASRAERDKMLGGGAGGGQKPPDKIDSLIEELLKQ